MDLGNLTVALSPEFRIMGIFADILNEPAQVRPKT